MEKLAYLVSTSVMNLGIFLPSWIGDLAMATPTLRALRRQFPEARFTGVIKPYLADVLEGTPWIDELVFHKPGFRDPKLGEWSLIKRLRERRLDAFVLLTNSTRTGFLAWASGARERIGYMRAFRGPFLTTKLYAPMKNGKRMPTPGIDAYLQLAYAMGCGLESPRMELATVARDEKAADAVWRKFQLPPGDVVVLNSGGAYGAAKLWPTEHFAQLARRIAVEQGYSVLVNCGPSERPIAAEIVRQAAHPRVVGLAEETALPIGLTKACIRRSRLLVTTDSGPRFFGVAFNVPTISLFGPTHIAWSRTHVPHEICLAKSVPCGPCMKRVCPLGHHQCMRDLTVETVMGAVDLQLRGRAAAA